MTIDKEISQKVIAVCKKKKIKIAAAESMTGGLFAKTLTDVPGASAVFDRSYITYSNEAKTSCIDVDPDTIKAFGAISAETAREMVEGVRIYSGCALCIAVTGNAGPDPAEGKPVGLYYIGFYYNGQTSVAEIKSSCKTRDGIRKDACAQMLKIIYEHIN